MRDRGKKRVRDRGKKRVRDLFISHHESGKYLYIPHSSPTGNLRIVTLVADLPGVQLYMVRASTDYTVSV